MKVLIIYDSYFGNTEAIARSIGDTLTIDHDVIVTSVKTVSSDQLSTWDVLVVGSPTRAFRPTAAITSFLKGLPPKGQSSQQTYAVFDTRVSLEEVNSRFLNFMVRLFGYASESMDRRLKRKGFKQAGTPQWFFVSESEGPLHDGEIERAAQWALTLV